jgi:sulfur carrier protein ThiS adenylyltransferase
MSGETIRILTVSEPALQSTYENTIFPQSEAQVGACTSRSTIYAAAIAAGFMVYQLVRQLRGLVVDPDFTLNLLASELIDSTSSMDLSELEV